jgi:hypothetical protein
MFKSGSEDNSKTSQFIAFNTHGWPRREVVQLPNADFGQLEKLVTQKLNCGGTLGELVIFGSIKFVLFHNMNFIDSISDNTRTL